MSVQKAVVHSSQSTPEVSSSVPIPKLRDDYVLVKTKAIALNPTDWKAFSRKPGPGTKSGCDFSGIIEVVGKAVTGYKEGDRVAGMIHGANANNHDDGAFAQYVVAKDGLFLKFPENVSFEDASTLGVGITTVGQGLYQSLGLPLLPATVQEPTPILIYGASTATGTLAVQFAKLSGCEVIATASPHNFALLKRLGADQVFDYREPNVGAKIRAATNDKLKLVLDCHSAGSSPQICADAISSSGGHYSSLDLRGDKFPRDDVKSRFTVAYTAFNEKWLGGEANQVDYEFARKFWKLSEELIGNGKIKTHPAEVREGGLDGVPDGLDDLKEGKVSGVKLVYKVE